MKSLFLITAILGFTGMSYATEQTETPYVLFGGPGKCSLTVHEKGFESDPGVGLDENNPEQFYADVTTSIAPNIIFHMKTKDGRRYVGYDGTSGYQLNLGGSSPWSKTPLSRGAYRLFEGKAHRGFCGKLVLRKLKN